MPYDVPQIQNPTPSNAKTNGQFHMIGSMGYWIAETMNEPVSAPSWATKSTINFSDVIFTYFHLGGYVTAHEVEGPRLWRILDRTSIGPKFGGVSTHGRLFQFTPCSEVSKH